MSALATLFLLVDEMGKDNHVGIGGSSMCQCMLYNRLKATPNNRCAGDFFKSFFSTWLTVLLLLSLIHI